MTTGTMHRIDIAIAPTKVAYYHHILIILLPYYIYIATIITILSAYYKKSPTVLFAYYSHIMPILCTYWTTAPSYDCSFAQTTNLPSDERLCLPKSTISSHWSCAITYAVSSVCSIKRRKSCYILAKASLFPHCRQFKFIVLGFPHYLFYLCKNRCVSSKECSAAIVCGNKGPLWISEWIASGSSHDQSAEQRKQKQTHKFLLYIRKAPDFRLGLLTMD